MKPEDIEAALASLTDPTTAPVLARALRYGHATSINHACQDGRIPGAWKVGKTWLIPLNGVRKALKDEKLRPRN